MGAWPAAGVSEATHQVRWGPPVAEPARGRGPAGRRHVRCQTCIGADPRQAPELRSRRGAAISARKRTQAAWDAGGGSGAFDPEAWPGIRAGLAGVKLAEITAATGLSKSFASAIRAGKSTPHPSLWAALAELGAATAPTLRDPPPG